MQEIDRWEEYDLTNMHPALLEGHSHQQWRPIRSDTGGSNEPNPLKIY